MVTANMFYKDPYEAPPPSHLEFYSRFHSNCDYYIIKPGDKDTKPSSHDCHLPLHSYEREEFRSADFGKCLATWFPGRIDVVHCF